MNKLFKALLLATLMTFTLVMSACGDSDSSKVVELKVDGKTVKIGGMDNYVMMEGETYAETLNIMQRAIGRANYLNSMFISKEDEASFSNNMDTNLKDYIVVMQTRQLMNQKLTSSEFGILKTEIKKLISDPKKEAEIMKQVNALLAKDKDLRAISIPMVQWLGTIDESDKHLAAIMLSRVNAGDTQAMIACCSLMIDYDGTFFSINSYRVLEKDGDIDKFKKDMSERIKLMLPK